MRSEHMVISALRTVLRPPINIVFAVLTYIFGLNEMMLYIFSYITVWRHEKIKKALAKQKSLCRRLNLLYTNIFLLFYDMGAAVLYVALLLTGTRTAYALRIWKVRSHKWSSYIIIGARDAIVDYTYLPIFLFICISGNLPLLAINLYSNANIMTEHKIKKSLIVVFLYIIKVEIPVAFLLALNIPLCIVYIWRPYLINVRADVRYKKRKFVSKLHYYFMHNVKYIVRDAITFSFLLLSIACVWRIRSIIHAFKYYKKSKHLYRWAIWHFLVLVGDILLLLVLFAHFVFIERWSCVKEIFLFEFRRIESNESIIYESHDKTLVRDEFSSLRYAIKSLLFCILDLMLLPINVLIFFTSYKLGALMQIYYIEGTNNYQEFMQYDRERYKLLFILYLEVLNDLRTLLTYIILIVGLWRILTYYNIYNYYITHNQAIKATPKSPFHFKKLNTIYGKAINRNTN